MPNIITHSLFAQELLNSLDAKWLNEREHLYTIGSNGPDFLFFSGLEPKALFSNREQENVLRAIGGKLHKGNVNAFYASALDSISKESDPSIKLDMMAYVCGHLCHWALDSTVHPYVYYRTGKGHLQNNFNHHRMESVLDSIILKVKKNTTIKDFYTPAIANCSLSESRAIARVYIPAIASIFNTKIEPHMIKETLDNWHFIQKAEYDPSGHKLSSLKKIEKGLRKKNLASGLIVPNVPEDNYDVCNLLHRVWSHPCDASLVYTKSFFDLYEEAMKKALDAIALFLKAVQDPKNKEEFLEFLGDRNYNTGIKNPPEMKNFDVCDFF